MHVAFPASLRRIAHRDRAWARFPLAAATLGFALGACISTSAAAPPLSGSLEILARVPVAGDPSPAEDVRWASDASVFLLRARDGLSEVSLSAGLASRRHLVPSIAEFGGGFRHFDTLAVSGGQLLVADGRQLATATLDLQPDGSRVYARQPLLIDEDLDLAGQRIVLLGYPRAAADATGRARQGVLWLGNVGQPLEAFRPLLFDATGPGPRALNACLGEELGAVRFLEDGSFLAVTGAEPGVHLFAPDGSLRESWTNAQLGLSHPDCADLATSQATARHLDPVLRRTRVNSMTVVDDILPLPEGPALIVRSFADGKVSWRLEVLRPAGAVTTYAIPLTSDVPADRLRGDIRGDRIVLLRSARIALLAGGDHTPGELVVTALPGTRNPSLAAESGALRPMAGYSP